MCRACSASILNQTETQHGKKEANMKTNIQNHLCKMSCPFVLSRGGMTWLLLALACGLALLLVPAFSPAQAAGTTRYVRVLSISGDTGDCTLPQSPCATIQYAVDQANAGDLIAIYGYTSFYKYRYYHQTNQRPSPPGYVGPAQVKQVVYIDKTLTLRGGYNYDFTTWDPATYKTVIQPGLDGDEGRAIFVAPGASPTLESLYIREGNATGLGGYEGGLGAVDAGGGIYAVGTSGGNDTITIRNCFIESNYANYYSGGVHLQYRPNALISGNTIRDNSNSIGGGIAIQDSANITFNSNEVVGNTGSAMGGGVFLRNSYGARVADNRIRDNSVSGYGGGLYADRADAGTGSIEILNNDIYSNTVVRLGVSPDASGIGGGIYLAGLDNVLVSGNRVYNNTADLAGGGIHTRYIAYFDSASASDALQLIGNTVYGNVASTSRSGYGGGVDLARSPVTLLQGNNVYGNIATSSSSSAHVGAGGGIHMQEMCCSWIGAAPLTIVAGNVITGNTANAGSNWGNGGGLRIEGSPVLFIRENLIAANRTTAGSGAPGTYGGGGAAIHYVSVVTLTNNLIARNRSPATGGDGLLLAGNTNATLLHNTFADNGLALSGVEGVALPSQHPRRLPSSRVPSTQAHRAAGLLSPLDTAIRYEDTFFSQSRKKSPGMSGPEGILVYANVTVNGINTLVSGHTLGVSVTDPANSTVAMNHTLWHNNTTNYSSGVTSTNERSGDPAFANPTAGDYHITATSAARDSGTNAGVTSDMDGDLRPVGGGYDIGADEYAISLRLPLIMR
jgi:parallel beta-helix repeat protein